jgi:hypothetical protein
MEFQEVFTSQFTTNTTCYSGACNPKSLRLATEHHVLSIDTKACEKVPRDSTAVICVGYSQRDGLEALALVDPAQLDCMDLDLPTIISPFSDNRDDCQSVVSTAQSVWTSQAGATASTASVTTNSTSTSTPKISSESTTATAVTTSTQPEAASSSSSTPKDQVDAEDVLESKKSRVDKARLILKNSKTEKEYFAFMDFRPLCPCVSSMGIWLGSADDSVLRLFVPKDEDRRLHAHTALPAEHFTFSTPIMALDYLEVGGGDDDDSTNTHKNSTRILAVACQDGTISVSSWGGNNDDFDDVTSSQVVVDGPLVCLQLSLIPKQQQQQQQQQPNEPNVRLVVGSLCGYVCEMVYTAGKWNGPFMIMNEGFWNQALEAEDSVLAVSTWESTSHVYIAMGTQLGRLLLYRKDQGKEQYRKLWECLLPYSVHGVVAKHNDEQQEQEPKRLQLVTTTRRSVHVFEETIDGFQRRKNEETGMDDKEKISDKDYSATLAKERLLLLLDEEEGENTVADETKDDQLAEGDWVVLSDPSGGDGAAAVEEETNPSGGDGAVVVEEETKTSPDLEKDLR